MYTLRNKTEKTLSDYINNVKKDEEVKKKLSFEEWYESYFLHTLERAKKDVWPESLASLEACWKAAQENAPSPKAPGARQRGYTQAEIDSWNAQGGSFTDEEIRRSTTWK